MHHSRTQAAGATSDVDTSPEVSESSRLVTDGPIVEWMQKSVSGRLAGSGLSLPTVHSPGSVFHCQAHLVLE